MRNFLQLTSGLHTMPLVLALAQQPHLWDRHQIRTTAPGTPVAACSDILLRFQPLADTETAHLATPDPHQSVWYPASATLPQARPLIFECMRLVEGERLGRVLLTRLPPGGHILPHRDADQNSHFFNFFHLPLLGSEHTPFRCGDETVVMQPGEAWWFNNVEEHELLNQGQEERLTLIVAIAKACPWQP